MENDQKPTSVETPGVCSGWGRRVRLGCVLFMFGMVMLVMGCIVHIEKSAVQEQVLSNNDVTNTDYTYIAGNVLLAFGGGLILISVMQSCCRCGGDVTGYYVEDGFENQPRDQSVVFSVTMTTDPPNYCDVTNNSNNVAPPAYCEVIDESVKDEKRFDLIMTSQMFP
uniref:uncharacterized protein LOC108950887 n=1 Tax=Ciona intestinalis TaxID=7719 RepID=UPI00089DB15D|nr:uncharacterized protein LOC108950887 [Ciona intestinalis]|eukprot:XP_018672676.1 uncharacterized protein LOC108950887 [Ciona intestinalis]